MASNAVIDEERLMSRLRWKLIPYVFLLYVVAILDRVNVGNAALTMNKELGISAAVFGTIAGIFFIFYFVFEVPSNAILHRVGARIWIARIMITWGIVTILQGFARGTVDLTILRSLLGAAEAGFYPGIVLYFTYWFTTRHHARAVSLFITGVAVANIIGNPIAGWILDNVNWLGMPGWRWLFIMEGIPAVALGILTPFVMTNRPKDAKFLSQEEKSYLINKLAEEQAAREKTVKMSEWGVLKSGRVWYFALAYFGYACGMNGINMWMPQIVKSLSSVLSNTQVGLISAIPFIFSAIAMVLVARHSDKTMERRLHSGLSMLVMVVALIGLTFTKDLVLSVILLCLAAAGIYGWVGTFWALPTAMLGEGTAAVGIALINSIGNLGGFVGPYLFGFLSDSTGSNTAGYYAFAGLVLMTSLLTLALPKKQEKVVEGTALPAEG
ncbi:MAG TPA: MFS transporter [Chloroflexota bacterium]